MTAPTTTNAASVVHPSVDEYWRDEIQSGNGLPETTIDLSLDISVARLDEFFTIKEVKQDGTGFRANITRKNKAGFVLPPTGWYHASNNLGGGGTADINTDSSGVTTGGETGLNGVTFGSSNSGTKPLTFGFSYKADSPHYEVLQRNNEVFSKWIWLKIEEVLKPLIGKKGGLKKIPAERKNVCLLKHSEGTTEYPLDRLTLYGAAFHDPANLWKHCIINRLDDASPRTVNDMKDAIRGSGVLFFYPASVFLTPAYATVKFRIAECAVGPVSSGQRDLFSMGNSSKRYILDSEGVPIIEKKRSREGDDEEEEEEHRFKEPNTDVCSVDSSFFYSDPA
jgi:hypothetical protein